MTKRLRSLAFVLVAVLLMGVGLAACGDDDDTAATTTTEAEEEEEEETTTTTESDEDEDEGEDEGDEDGQQAAVDDFINELDSELDPEAATDGYTFVELTDDTGQLTVSAPAEWSDVDGALGTFGPDIRASTDLDAYNTSYDVPGFQFTATIQSTTGDVNRVLDELALRTSQDCDRLDREPYSDPVYTGVSQIFENCVGTEGASFVWVAVEPADEAYIAVVGVQVLTEADTEALGEILNTFLVTPR
jgi:hypothetical protein